MKRRNGSQSVEPLLHSTKMSWSVNECGNNAKFEVTRPITKFSFNEKNFKVDIWRNNFESESQIPFFALFDIRANWTVCLQTLEYATLPASMSKQSHILAFAGIVLLVSCESLNRQLFGRTCVKNCIRKIRRRN